jgi:hypothetical protein
VSVKELRENGGLARIDNTCGLTPGNVYWEEALSVSVIESGRFGEKRYVKDRGV